MKQVVNSSNEVYVDEAWIMMVWSLMDVKLLTEWVDVLGILADDVVLQVLKTWLNDVLHNYVSYQKFSTKTEQLWLKEIKPHNEDRLDEKKGLKFAWAQLKGRVIYHKLCC